MASRSFWSLLTLPLLASAHFHILYPTPRSSVDDTEATFPCGGFPVSDNRTIISSTSFPLALEMGHDRTVIQVLLALGSNPGDNFNIVLERSFQQQGEGSFCLPDVVVPSDLNITDGANGTIQVVTDGEGGGGLYVCADVTFSTTSAINTVPSSCTNGTGITAAPLASNVNANETNADGSPQSGSGTSSASVSASASGSATGTASGSTASTTNAAVMFTAGWGVLGAAILGGMALM